MATTHSSEGLRLCANIKSKKVSDQPCKSEAILGDFCARHSIHPTRYPLYKTKSTTYSFQTIQHISKLQIAYRFRRGLRRFRRQGPATSDTTLAHNTTELSTFEPSSSIPLLYRFSFTDSTRHTWLFDLRTLFQIVGQTTTTEYTNPYTRETIPQHILQQLYSRIENLHKKRYCLLWIISQELLQSQFLHQQVIDIALKFEALGFHICSSWFEELSLDALKNIYILISNYCLKSIPKETLHNVYPSEEPLFAIRLSTIHQRKDKKILQNALLQVFEKLLTTATETENKVLGAVYILKAWATEVDDIYTKYSWLD